MWSWQIFSKWILNFATLVLQEAWVNEHGWKLLSIKTWKKILQTWNLFWERQKERKGKKEEINEWLNEWKKEKGTDQKLKTAPYIASDSQHTLLLTSTLVRGCVWGMEVRHCAGRMCPGPKKTVSVKDIVTKARWSPWKPAISNKWGRSQTKVRTHLLILTSWCVDQNWCVTSLRTRTFKETGYTVLK